MIPSYLLKVNRHRYNFFNRGYPRNRGDLASLSHTSPPTHQTLQWDSPVRRSSMRACWYLFLTKMLLLPTNLEQAALRYIWQKPASSFSFPSSSSNLPGEKTSSKWLATDQAFRVCDCTISIGLYHNFYNTDELQNWLNLKL